MAVVRQALRLACSSQLLSMPGAVSASIVVTRGPRARIEVTSAPAAAVAGIALTSIRAAVVDAQGNLDTSAVVELSLSLNSGVAPLRHRNTIVTIVASTTFAGETEFTEISFDKVGAKVFSVTAIDLQGGTSSTVQVTPGAAVALGFATEPQASIAGVALAEVVVAGLDQFGNPTPELTSAVTVSATGPGAIAGTLTVAAAGVAEFDDLSFTRAGRYHLRAETMDPELGLLFAESAPFLIEAAAPASLAFTSAVPNTPVGGRLPRVAVSTVDAFNNVVSEAAGSVQFGDVSISAPGIHRLRATLSAGTLDPALSNNFTIEAIPQLSLDPLPPAVSGCTVLDYDVAQEAGRAVDTSLTINGDSVRRATQSGALTGHGHHAVPTTNTPAARSFTWNSMADIRDVETVTLSLAVSPAAGGDAASNTSTSVLVDNGPGASLHVQAFVLPAVSAVTDLEHDRRDELVVSSATGVDLMRRAGNGDFVVDQSLALLEASDQIVPGDFNRDGCTDIAVALSSSVLVKRSNGAPCTAYTDVSIPVVSLGLAIADFNHDGRLDLAVVTAAGALQLFLGNVVGDFDAAPAAAALLIGPVVTADLNRDGFVDVIAADATGFAVWPGVPSGVDVQNPETLLGPAPSKLMVADFNQDGAEDIVGLTSSGVVVALGDGGFGFSTPQIIESVGDDIAIADFDADGSPDVLIGSTANGVRLRRGVGDGTFFAARTLDPAAASSVLALHLSRSRTVDFLSANGSSMHAGTVVRKAGCEPALVGALAGRAQGLSGVGDVNGDGRLDVLSYSPDGGLLVSRGHGDGQFTRQATVPSDSYNPDEEVALTSCDLDRDGDLDFVAAQGGGELMLFTNDGSGGFVRTLLAGGTFGGRAFCSDVDNDGFVDVTQLYSGFVRVVWGALTNSFSESTSEFFYDGYLATSQIVDIDGDGDLDVGYTTDTVSAWVENVGDRQFAPSADLWLAQSTSALFADLTGDGLIDAYEYDQGSLSQLRVGTAPATFALPSPMPTNQFGGFYTVVADDLDQDGRMDLVGSRSELFAVLHQTASGWTKDVEQRVVASINRLHIEDVTGDGLRDIVTSGDGIVMVLPQHPPQGELLRFGEQHLPLSRLSVGANAVMPSTFRHDGRVEMLVHGSDEIDVVDDDQTERLLGLATPFLAVDLNHDGWDDLIQRQQNFGEIWLNNRSGGFDSQDSFFTGNFVSSPAIAAADFNRDGVIDLAANSRSNFPERRVLFFDGASNFSQFALHDVVSCNLMSLFAIDLNRDASPDLAYVCLDRTQMGVIFGDGSGGLEVASFAGDPTSISVSSEILGITVDGHDLLILHSDSVERLSWDGLAINNTPTGGLTAVTEASFGPLAIGGFSTLLSSPFGDLNRDGEMDVVVLVDDNGTTDMCVLLGPAYQPQCQPSPQARDFRLVDVDEDGTDDIVTMDGISRVLYSRP